MRAGWRRSKQPSNCFLRPGRRSWGAGIGEAQDRVLAQPTHRVQVQGPHALYGHPARTEDFPGPGLDRLPQRGPGQAREGEGLGKPVRMGARRPAAVMLQVGEVDASGQPQQQGH